MRRFITFGAAILGCFMSVGCATKQTTSSVSSAAEPLRRIVKIGVGAPISGQIAALGQGNVNGAQLAIEEANKRNLRIGDQSVIFELVVEDDGADPRKGVAAAQRLVSQGVVAVVGHLNSGISIPASAIYNAANIPMITPSSSNPRLMQQGFSGVFRMVGNDATQGVGIADYVFASQKKQSFTVIDDGTAYGQVICDPVIETARRRYQKTPRYNGTFSALERSAKQIAARAVDAQADVLVYCGLDSDALVLFREIRALSRSLILIGPDGIQTDEMGKNAVELVPVFASSSDPVWTKDAATEDFDGKYFARFQTKPEPYSVTSFDATNVLISAMTASNSVDPTKFVKQMRNVTFDAVTGKVRFDASGERIDTPVTILELVEGKWKPVSVQNTNQAR